MSFLPISLFYNLVLFCAKKLGKKIILRKLTLINAVSSFFFLSSYSLCYGCRSRSFWGRYRFLVGRVEVGFGEAKVKKKCLQDEFEEISESSRRRGVKLRTGGMSLLQVLLFVAGWNMCLNIMRKSRLRVRLWLRGGD